MPDYRKVGFSPNFQLPMTAHLLGTGFYLISGKSQSILKTYGFSVCADQLLVRCIVEVSTTRRC